MKEPILMKAGDKRVLVNGFPLPVDYRIIWEENYQELKKAFDTQTISVIDAQKYAEYCVMSDRLNHPIVKLNDFLTHR